MKLILATTIATVLIGTTTAQAGGLAPTIDTQEVVIPAPEPRAGAAAYIVPLVFLGLVIAAANSDAASGSTDGDTTTLTTDGVGF